MILSLLVMLISASLALAGENVHLTLDPKIQSALEESMTEHPGAAVVMDAQNGDIVGIVSNPCKGKAAFVMSAAKWNALSDDSSGSFLAKAMIPLHPGATFLPVTTLAALKSGKITPETKLNCSGSFRVENTNFACWEKNGHGDLTLRNALVNNCGIFFYQLGLRTGIDSIIDMAKRAGFGEKSGLFAHEDPGFAGTPQWKQSTQHATWSDGDTANLAIGQGYLDVTPLQMTAFMGALANGGTVYHPRLIKEGAPEKKIHSKLDVDPASLEAVRSALVETVENGTAKFAKIKGLTIAAKTGSSQVPRKNSNGEVQRETLAWICGFAPYDQPRYAFCILVEGGVSGGHTAGPIAHHLLCRIFGKAEVER